MGFGTSLRHHARRSLRGAATAAAALALPLGGWWLGRTGCAARASRLARGLAVVLPGIEGRGALGWSIYRGLQDGGFPGAVLLWDWTTGLWPLLLFHLRSQGFQRARAAALAAMIADYQRDHPGRPVYLVGHSGGAAIAAQTLECLPAGHAATVAVLLGAALSPRYPLGPALAKVQGCVWNFWTPLDVPLLGAGALVFGTMDGRHSVAAGLCGFAVPRGATAAEAALYGDRLRQRRYHWRMARRFHLGGHFGWANRVFVAEEIAPLLATEQAA